MKIMSGGAEIGVIKIYSHNHTLLRTRSQSFSIELCFDKFSHGPQTLLLELPISS